MLKGYRFDRCQYDDCYADSDCRGGGVCVCGDRQNVCAVAGDCRQDADCGAGRWCASSFACGDVLVGYFCRTLADECEDDDMCGGRPVSRCAFDERARRWSCLRCAR